MRLVCRSLLVLVLVLFALIFFAQEQASSPTTNDYLRSFHTIQVKTGTWLSKPEMLQGALQKHPEFDQWGLSIVVGSGADTILTIDHQPGWFKYTYSLTHSASGVVLLAGTVDAWDGNVACKKIADDLVKRIKKVRPVSKP